MSACFNVENYIDSFLRSLENQSLDFKLNFQIILVDDGSTDKTAEIIKSWVKKYPENIVYLYQENQGQASARNRGLDYVSHSWVSFLDPDDFIDCNAFRRIDKYLQLHQGQLDILSMNIVYFYEDGIGLINNHPLLTRLQNS